MLGFTVNFESAVGQEVYDQLTGEGQSSELREFGVEGLRDD